MFAALSTVRPDGTMPLPHLRTIICPFPAFLFPDGELTDGGRRRNTASLVHEMLRVRASHGAPVTCMRVGSPEGELDDSEEHRRMDEQLRGLAASYITQTER